MRKISLTISLLFFIPIMMIGQELILKTVDELEDIRVNDMVFGEQGELAIIDDQRLFVYDGYELNLVWTSSSNDDRFKVLFQMDDIYYIGTSEGHVLMSKDGKVSTIMSYDQVRVNSIVGTQDKKLLVTTDGKGMHVLDPILGKTESLELGVNLNHVNEVVSSGNRFVYVTDQGVYTSSLKFDKIQKIEQLEQRLIDRIFSTEHGDLWMSDFDGNVIHFGFKDQRLIEIHIDDQVKITDLSFADDRLFVSTQKGIYQISNITSPIVDVRLVGQGSSRGLLIDDECNLWVAKDGMIQRASLYFSRFRTSPNQEIHSMSSYKNKLLLGTEKGILSFDPKMQVETLLKKEVNITCMEYSSNTLAVGTYDSGVLLYDDTAQKPMFLGKSEGLRDNTVLALEFKSETELIVSSLAGIDLLEKQQGKWQARELDKNLNKFYILSIFSGGDGSLWFGTDRKGIIKYSHGEINLLDSTIVGNQIGTVSSIKSGQDQSIWLISEESGLLKYTSNGLSEEASPHGTWGIYTSLIALESNRFLLIGEREVSIYDPNKKELIQFGSELELERGTSFLNNYTLADSEVYFEHNGTLYLFHDIRDVKRTNSLTSLIRVEVDLAPKDTSLHDFSEFENSFQFTYSGILHRNQEEIQYSYRLLGYDDSWRMTKDRQVAYSHLTPGNYTFQVRSSHDIFHAEVDIISYSFTIHRLFNRTVWFRTMVIVAILALIFWWRQRGLKAKELRDKYALLSTETKLLNLKSQLNPHFLFNSFNTVIGLIEEDKERSVKYIEHLTDFYRMVLELGDSDLIPINQELELLSAYIHLLSERFGDALELVIPSSFNEFFIPPMSLQLLVENAVKHNIASDSRPLRIEIKETERTIIIMNGINLRSSVKDSMGIGLENLKQRFLILAQKDVEVRLEGDFFLVELPKIFGEINQE